MLLWQQNTPEVCAEYYNEQQWHVKGKAFGLALACYCLVCFVFFMPTFKEPVQAPVITVQSHGAPVVFDSYGSPSGRRASTKKESHKNVPIKSPSQSAVSKKQEPVKSIIKSEPQKKKQEKKKEPLKKPALEVKKPEAKKIETKKNEVQEASKRKIIEKTIPKKEPEKVQKKEIEKKLETKKPVSLEKKEKEVEVKKIEKQITQAVQALIEPEVPAPSKSQPAVIPPEDIIISQADGAGDGEQSVGTIAKSHIALSRAITRAWSPPQTQGKVNARIIVHVGTQGKVNSAEFDQKSGVVAYDLAARAAVLRAEYPKEFWGASVAIVFGT